MPILDRYLFRECLGACLMSLAVLLGVILALFLAELLGDAAQGQVTARDVFLLLILRLPEASLLVGPLALLTGLLLALGRLVQDRELVVMRGGGLSPERWLRVLGLLALLWASGLIAIGGWLGPAAIERSAQVLERAAREAVIGNLRPGHFERLEQGRLSLYAARLERNDGSLEDVFIHHDGEIGPEIITAAEGRIWIDPDSGLRYLSLFRGSQVRHAGEAPGLPVRRLDFDRNDILLPPPRSIRVGDQAARMRLPDLMRAGGAAERREWHWRLAPSVASILLGLLAAPLALRRPRAGRFSGVLLALLFYLAYSNAIHVGMVLMERRDGLAGPGLWPVHGTVAALVAMLWWYARRRW